MDQRLARPTKETPTADAAAYWMMRKQSGSMDADERAAFRQWLSACAENAREFASLEKLLGEIDLHGEALLNAEFERELHMEADHQAQSRTLRFGKIAATLAIASIAVLIAVFALPFGGPEQASYVTAKGQYQTIELDDGSEAELNSGTRMTVAYGASQRLVTLESGEAFFNVEKDKDRPFLVKTGRAEIMVTGTSFSVSELNGISSVHVLTGVVDVTPLKGPAATLLAGDMIEVAEVGTAGPITRYDPGMVLAWRSGMARFRDQPLGDVIETLNRYFETPIELGDPSLASLPVTGEFDIRDHESAVKALALIFNLESTEEPARIILKRDDSP